MGCLLFFIISYLDLRLSNAYIYEEWTTHSGTLNIERWMFYLKKIRNYYMPGTAYKLFYDHLSTDISGGSTQIFCLYSVGKSIRPAQNHQATHPLPLKAIVSAFFHWRLYYSSYWWSMHGFTLVFENSFASDIRIIWEVFYTHFSLLISILHPNQFYLRGKERFICVIVVLWTKNIKFKKKIEFWNKHRLIVLHKNIDTC